MKFSCGSYGNGEAYKTDRKVMWQEVQIHEVGGNLLRAVKFLEGKKCLSG